MTSIAQHTDITPDVPDQLLAAADHIERYGLNKGSYFGFGNSLRACTLGAIAQATTPVGEICEPEMVDAEPPARAFLEYLRNNVPGLVLRFNDVEDTDPEAANLILTVGGWNDAPERTAEQVVDTLRSAARWAGER